MNSNNEIRTTADLEASFQSFMNEPLSALQENVAGEFVRVHSVSEWVQIAFIRQDEEIGFEVEVSIPNSYCGQIQSDPSSQFELLHGMMSHLLYIKELLELGFKLSIIREDCLWVANYLVSEGPSQEVFEAMVPPTKK